MKNCNLIQSLKSMIFEIFLEEPLDIFHSLFSQKIIDFTLVLFGQITVFPKLVMRLPINKTKGYFQTIFFMKNSKFLPKYHLNLFPKSQFSSYINPRVVILFCEVQNQNKQKGTSRYLYQNKNKRPRFLTQKSDS